MEYKLLEAVAADGKWVDELTVMTMKPYVEAAWENEADRLHYYKLNRFDLEHTKIIIVDGRRAGRLTVRSENDLLDLADLHLLPEFHGSGLGTRIIKDIIAEAFGKNLAVELKCLRTNPVQGLYRRLGFKLIDEDEKRLYYRIEKGDGALIS